MLGSRAAASVLLVAGGALLAAATGAAARDDDPAGDPDAQKPHSKEDQEVADRVASVRALEWKGRVPFREIAREELEKILELSFDDEYGDGVATGKAFAALGLIPPGTSWRDQVLAEKAAKVKAFYLAKKIGDYGDGRVYIVEGLEGRQRMGTLAHELVHAIDDQHYDLERKVRKIPRTASDHRHSDRFCAFMSAEEGVAQVVWRAIMAAGAAPEAEADIFLRKVRWADALIRFRFAFGPKFVEAVRAAGGWEAVNALYADPPESSEQILHPERFLGGRDTPHEVTFPDIAKARVLQGEWRVLRADSLGELGVAWMFGTGVGVGWDGDGYLAIESEWDGQVIACWMTTWDEIAEASHFATAWAEMPPPLAWLPDGKAIFIEQREKDVLVLTGVERRQVEPLRKLLWKKVQKKRSGGESSRPEGSSPGELPEKLAVMAKRYAAKRGVAVLERAGERIRWSRSLQLDDEGRTACKEMLRELRERAKKPEQRVEDLGRGAFLESLGEELGVLYHQLKSSNLVVGNARAREELEELRAFVEDLR